MFILHEGLVSIFHLRFDFPNSCNSVDNSHLTKGSMPV